MSAEKMVLTKNIIKWQCPYCGSLYDEEDEAEDCADNCVDIETPIKVETIYFYCEMCNKKYTESEDVIECENKHKKKKDYYYESYISDKEKKILEKAARHPSQKKLDMNYKL